MYPSRTTLGVSDWNVSLILHCVISMCRWRLFIDPKSQPLPSLWVLALLCQSHLQWWEKNSRSNAHIQSYTRPAHAPVNKFAPFALICVYVLRTYLFVHIDVCTTLLYQSLYVPGLVHQSPPQVTSPLLIDNLSTYNILHGLIKCKSQVKELSD